MNLSTSKSQLVRICVLYLVLIISPISVLKAGIVKTFPAHQNHNIVVAANGQVLIWAEGYGGAITSSSMTVSPDGPPQPSGSNGSYTIQFPAGTEDNSYTCTLTLTHKDGDVTCATDKTFTYTVYVPAIKIYKQGMQDFEKISDSNKKIIVGEQVNIKLSMADYGSAGTDQWTMPPGVFAYFAHEAAADPVSYLNSGDLAQEDVSFSRVSG